MIYRDSNNTIMIDDVEANEDVRRLNNAKDKLEKVLSDLEHICSINAEMSGEISQGIDDSVLNLKNKINNQIESIANTVTVIRDVVNKYKAIDENSNSTINTTV